MPKKGVSRVESMFSKLSIVGLGSIGERVVGPVHQGVLAKHGSHDCRLCGEKKDRTEGRIIFDAQGGGSQFRWLMMLTLMLPYH
jgi:hypothetical protein